MRGVQSTGDAVLACELLILLIYVVVRPTDASTGEIATEIPVVQYLLPWLTPLNIHIKYVTDCLEFVSCCRVQTGSKSQQFWQGQVKTQVNVSAPQFDLVFEF